MKDNHTADIKNIYQLDGKVPLGKAIPFGLQHILAMFVANIAPILIVAGVCGLNGQQSASLIQWCHDHSWYRYVNSVVPNMESWIRSSNCHGY